MIVELKKVGLCDMEFRWSQPYPGLAGGSTPCSSLVRPHLQYCVQLKDPAEEGGGPAQASPEAATKMIRGSVQGQAG